LEDSAPTASLSHLSRKTDQSQVLVTVMPTKS
jgi:hypothetical protein